MYSRDMGRGNSREGGGARVAAHLRLLGHHDQVVVGLVLRQELLDDLRGTRVRNRREARTGSRTRRVGHAEASASASAGPGRVGHTSFTSDTPVASLILRNASSYVVIFFCSGEGGATVSGSNDVYIHHNVFRSLIFFSLAAPRDQGTRKGTRRVQLVRRDGRDVSTLYGRGGVGVV